MDLPADKMKMLKEFPSEKKWDIIRDRVNERVFDKQISLVSLIDLGSSDCQASTTVLY